MKNFSSNKLYFLLIAFTFQIFLLISNKADAALLFDPALKWKSIKTEHFWIHYHQGLEDEAYRLTKIAENVHLKLTKDIGWAPALRTDVVLVDNTDLANGFATPLPFNRVQIFISRPKLDSTLNNFDDWLKIVFTHEYTHILNLDTVHYLPRATRYIFGRLPLFFPNMFLPVWALEGNAVYHESEISKFGRNNSTYTDMIIRTEVISGGLKSIDKASSFPREWPMGRVPYHYGGLFVKFLEEKYGKGSFAKYFHENADNIIPFSDHIYPIPYFYNKDAKDVYKKSFIRLWKEWQEYTREKYIRQIKKISEKGITEFITISNEKDNSKLPSFSRDGKSIYYIRSSARNGRKLIKYDINRKIGKELCRVNYPNSITVMPGDAIYLSDVEYYRSFSLYYEAYRYKKRYKRLSKRLRSSYIDSFKNENKFIRIKNDLNRYSMYISDLEFRNNTPIIKNSDIQLSFPKMSPDDKRVIFTIKESNGYSDLVLLDLNDKTFRRLTNDPSNDIQPSWHPDGKRIIFSSDKNGVYNLYEYDLGKKKISRITNLIGGAFNPDISIDGKSVVFSAYQQNGHRISIMNYPDKSYSTIDAEMEKMDPDFFLPKSDNKSKSLKNDKIKARKYCPAYSVFPAYLIPIFMTAEYYPDKYDFGIGFITQGMDTLFQHYYQITALAYPIQKNLSLDVSYTMSMFYPNITIGYYDDTIFFGKDEFPWKKYSQYEFQRIISRYGYLSLLFPFTFYNHVHNLRFSYVIEQEFTDIYGEIYSDINGNIYTDRYGYLFSGGTGIYFSLPYVSHYRSLLARVQAAYFFSCTKRYPYSISREDGRELLFVADIFHQYLGSSISFYKMRAEYSEYLPGFASNNVTMLRLRGGLAINYPEKYLGPYNLGRFEKGYIGSAQGGVDRWGMRGYPAGIYYGERLLIGSVEYRLPIVQVDAGIFTAPVMFRDLWVEFFCEYGNVWNGNPDIRKFKSNLGIELNLNLTLGYYLDITGYIGYAYGFNQYGEHQVYFAISTLIEGRLKNKNSTMAPFAKIY